MPQWGGQEDGAKWSAVFEVCGGLEGELVQVGGRGVCARCGGYLSRQWRSGRGAVGIFARYWGWLGLLLGE